MRLTKIYTRTGDQGTTRLANGDEVQKDSLRVIAYGDIDELNSFIGLVISQVVSKQVKRMLASIQHTLFDLGGELASADMITGLVTAEHTVTLENYIDEVNAGLPPLEEFILPGGTEAAATLHLARSVCRRAERHIISLDQIEKVTPEILQYVNRLSDLLFVLARFENHRSGNQEIYWKNPRK